MKRKIFTFLLSAFLGNMAMAQGSEAVIKKTETAPAIDGVIDAIWENADANNIVVPFKDEAATVGAEGETTWKALWNDDGMYILVVVADDNWLPYWAEGGGTNSWEYDKLELYFDTNVPRQDATGGHGDTQGSVQLAPDSKLGEGIDGTKLTGTAFGIEYNYAIKVTEPNYVVEYFVPWDILKDKDGVIFDKTTEMGFDITVIDRDPGDAARKRVNWGNAGASDENWNNMDDAGVITFDGATEFIYVDKIQVSGGTEITTDDGTLQLTATLDPIDATAQKVKWVVENGTGRATISKDGLLTAIVDGTVLVKAIAQDVYGAEGKVTVTISGQKLAIADINMIKNGNFELGADGKESWGSDNSAGGIVEDGWYNLYCTPKTNLWDLMITQKNVPVADAVTPYTVRFKAVATADMMVPMLFEDRSNGSNKALTSTSVYRGAERWEFPVTTEPQWFTVDVIFSALVENSAYEFNFQVGLVEGTLSLDSIQMYSDADFAMIETSARTLSNVNNVKLYPNPVQNELIVSKIAVANSKVSVYNAVGQKLIERTAIGHQAKFDVSNLRKGMYFVRFSDGSSQKFLKQ